MGISIIKLKSFIKQRLISLILTQCFKIELNQDIFTTDVEPEPILDIDDIAAYNKAKVCL
jgi:hypothetical protein